MQQEAYPRRSWPAGSQPIQPTPGNPASGSCEPSAPSWSPATANLRENPAQSFDTKRDGGWAGDERPGPRELAPKLGQSPREPTRRQEPREQPRTEAGPRAAPKLMAQETRKEPQPGAAATHITATVLDAHDVRVLGERDHRIHGQGQARVGWDAVEHHRDWGEVSDLREAEKGGEVVGPEGREAPPTTTSSGPGALGATWTRPPPALGVTVLCSLPCKR